MAELHLPLLVHTGAEHSFTWSRDEFADPARLRLPLSLGVTVIAAHAAWPGRHDGQRDVDRLASLMREYPNLYADISSLTQINKLGALREVLRRPEFRGRLVYGTDFPLINMPIVSPWFFPLDLSLRQRWQISRIKNPWDRDVALKQALGVPADVFTRAEKLLPDAASRRRLHTPMALSARGAIPLSSRGGEGGSLARCSPTRPPMFTGKPVPR